MKSRGLFLSALMMTAVWAGCSNEEGLDNIQPREIEKSDSYIAVNIVAPGVNSRAADDNFLVGTATENAVNSALFVFFDENGGFVQAVDVDATDLNDWTKVPDEEDGTVPSVDMISSAVIVLNNPSSAPKQVVAILNSSLTAATLGTPTLAELHAKTDNYATGFVMTNSVYWDDTAGKQVFATPLEDDNIQRSEELAKGSPVSISVERVVAKVTATQSDAMVIEGKEVELDGIPNQTLAVTSIDGYKLVATNPVSYLIKNIEDYDVLQWTGWNDPANLRSYWANSAVPANGYNYFTYNEMLLPDDYAEYCLENTSKTPTQLLVAATIKPKDAPNAVDIVKYKGLYYTGGGFLDKVNEMLSAYYYNGTDDQGNTIQSNDWKGYLEVVDAGTEEQGYEPWEVKVVLKKEAPDVQGVQTTLNTMDTAAQWTGGRAYFFVNVKGLFADGVVRNHAHVMNITKMVGLGTPVYNPDEIIIPEIFPEQNYYVAAEVQILKWKQVAQDVVLGQ